MCARTHNGGIFSIKRGAVPDVPACPGKLPRLNAGTRMRAGTFAGTIAARARNQGETSVNGDAAKYWAFISYIHQDKRKDRNLLADWLHDAVEVFKAPRAANNGDK